MENMNNQEELATVENLYWAEMARDLAELKEDPRFKRVIMKGYFEDKAINGVSLLGLDQIRTTGKRAEVMEDLVAISKLQEYFMIIENLGTCAEEDIEED